MLSILYPVGYTVSLIGLILWFYYEEKENAALRKLTSSAFMGGFLVYLFSLAFADGSTSYKMLTLFRDMSVLGVVAIFFNFFKNNQLVFITMLVLLFGFLRFDHYKRLQQTFPEVVVEDFENPVTPTIKNNSKIELDKNGELLVEVKEDHQLKELQNIVDQYGLTYERAFFPKESEATDLDDYVVVNVPDQFEGNISEIEKALLESGLIDWVEENEVINISPIEVLRPSKKKRSFGINDPGVSELWGFDEMRMDELYAVLKSKKVKPKKKASIFILDTGVDSKHEDLSSNYKSYKSNYDNDPNGHGTHCAGIAAAVTNNKKGVASYNLNNNFTTVTGIKVLASYGGGTQKGIISGMLEAADAGADVISMSLGGPSNKSRQRAYARAVNYCNRKGAIVVAAAGNSNQDAAKYSPANSPGIITVAAVDTSLNRAHFSNYVNNVDRGIAAPGVKIYSTYPKDEYKTFNGTSMACPYVAGLLGLMKSINPDLTTQEAYDILNKTGRATNATKETGKLIQPAEVVKALL